MKHALLILIALLLAPLAAQAAEAPKSPGKPNIIIILTDDLGYGDVRCFNLASKIQTPNIDQLAADGMRFTDAHAPASVCVPSRYGLLTGRFPFRTWLTQGQTTRQRNGRELPHYQAPMIMHDPQRLNLASLLKRNGYATAAFGKWHQGMSPKPDAGGTLAITPVDFGFDYYFGFDAPEQGPYAFVENKRFVSPLEKQIPEQLGQDVTNPKAQGAHCYPGEASKDWDFQQCLPRIAAKADAWITRHQAMDSAHPFFIYHAIPAPHAPWTPADEFKNKSAAGPYGDYVTAVDATVGQLLKTLDKLGLKENTLILFSSDNGPVWYPQDVARYSHQAAGPWRGMKGALYEAGHRMPFIARWPGKIPPASSCDQLICFTDMMATFAALVGDTLPQTAAEDSFNILPLLLGQPTPTLIRAGIIHPNWGSYTLAIRQGNWKLILPEWTYTVQDRTITPDQIVPPNSDHPGTFQLYNLRTDPAETTNLADKEPGKVKMLFDALKSDIQRGRTRP